MESAAPAFHRGSRRPCWAGIVGFADECTDGVPVILSYLRVGIIGASYTFNLRERELETLLLARSANTATEVLRENGAAG